MTYDTYAKYAKVVVSEAPNGELSAVVTYGENKTGATNKSLTVTNVYSKVTFRPEAKKSVTGDPADA